MFNLCVFLIHFASVTTANSFLPLLGSCLDLEVNVFQNNYFSNGMQCAFLIISSLLIASQLDN